ncbi:MAG TPA: AMP-binding protein [Candidatus Binatia bacterium]|nr:AMP-binding protein [Candidatus Binatia bacterium]
MQATRPPDARRAGHEARGEWPQPPLSTLATRRARATPDCVFVVEATRDGARSHTFADLERRATRMAVALRRLGLGRGDVVSWQLPNWFEGAALAVAIDRVGAVSNPIIGIYREREVAFVCREARTRALVVPGAVRGVDHRELAAAVRGAAPDLEHVLTVRAAPGAGMRALEALEDDPPAPLPPSPHGPHDVSMLFYTSGTTADPKGVLHTPSTAGALIHVHAAMHGARPDERALLQFPLTHIGGVLLFVQLPVTHGSSAVFMDAFDPALAVDLIERYAVTGAGGPPAVLQAIFAAPSFAPEKVRSVRSSGSGAADVSPALMRETARRFPDAAVYRSYGMTECPMFTSGRREDPEEKRFGTDGRPAPGCIARLVDDAGRPVPAGVEGEVEAYGPQLCVGYLDPALNVAFTTDGFFRTGDLAVVDADGFVRITGRRKDVIIRKGENLSAKGIEDELAAHPAVADVAVIGVPDAERGERVCACVVLRPGAGALDVAAVRAFMEGRGVMRQKIPEQVELLDELPRNATGKVRKDVLRARFGPGG